MWESLDRQREDGTVRALRQPSSGVEQRFRKPQVVGSNPMVGSEKFLGVFRAKRHSEPEPCVPPRRVPGTRADTRRCDQGDDVGTSFPMTAAACMAT